MHSRATPLAAFEEGVVALPQLSLITNAGSSKPQPQHATFASPVSLLAAPGLAVTGCACSYM